MLKMSGDNTPPGDLIPPFPPDFKREGRVGEAFTLSASCFNSEGFEEGDNVDEREGEPDPVEEDVCKAGDPVLLLVFLFGDLIGVKDFFAPPPPSAKSVAAATAVEEDKTPPPPAALKAFLAFKTALLAALTSAASAAAILAAAAALSSFVPLSAALAFASFMSSTDPFTGAKSTSRSTFP